MDKVKVLQVDTNAATKSVKDLKNELKSLKDTLVSTAKGTEEYNQALQQAADIQHQLKEQMEEINATAMDFGQIMGNVVNAAGGMVAGFQAAKATMNLFGVENEGVMKSLQKMQNLMAITQALPGIEKGIKSLKRLVILIDNATTSTKSFSNAQKAQAATETASTTATKGLQGAMVGEAAATGAATVATHAFKKALISTGIGAIVVLVGTLIAHLEDLAKWLGFGGDSTEKLKKKTLELKQAYESTNATIDQWSTSLEGLKFTHEQRTKALEDEIAKMEAAGKSESELAAKRQELLKQTKEMADEEVETLNKQQKTIEDEYLKLMKSIAGSTYNTTLSMGNMYRELNEAQRLVLNAEQELAKLEANDASDAKIEKQKQLIEQAKQRQKLLTSYISSQKEEISINQKATDQEIKLQKQRTDAAKKAAEERKKLTEEYKKFENQIVLDQQTGLTKQKTQLNIAEEEKKNKLKEYKKKNIISEEEYQRQLTAIQEYYERQRNEATFAAQVARTKKVENIEKQNADIAKNARKLEADAYELSLQEEDVQLFQSLKQRKISLSTFYQQRAELALKSIAKEKEIRQKDYDASKTLLEQQVEDNLFLLEQKGISDEQRNEILNSIGTLNSEIENLQKEHNNNMAALNAEERQVRSEGFTAALEAETEYLTSLKDQVVDAMNAIMATGDGLSTNWATAFDTLTTGLINLNEEIKAGEAGWDSYAKMAGAAFSAIGSMMSALADEQDASTKEGFEKQKKYQIAAATMQMLAGITTALSGVFTTKTGPWDIALAAIQAGIIATTGAIQIAKIKQQKFDSGSGGGGASNPSAAAAASVVAPVQYTQDVQGANIEGAIKDTKVYVTETDITDTQNRVSVQESENTY